LGAGLVALFASLVYAACRVAVVSRHSPRLASPEYPGRRVTLHKFVGPPLTVVAYRGTSVAEDAPASYLAWGCA
jgi:hypothetical protein